MLEIEAFECVIRDTLWARPSSGYVRAVKRGRGKAAHLLPRPALSRAYIGKHTNLEAGYCWTDIVAELRAATPAAKIRKVVTQGPLSRIITPTAREGRYLALWEMFGLAVTLEAFPELWKFMLRYVILSGDMNVCASYKPMLISFEPHASLETTKKRIEKRKTKNN